MALAALAAVAPGSGVEEHPVKASKAAGITSMAVNFSDLFFMGLFPFWL